MTSVNSTQPLNSNTNNTSQTNSSSANSWYSGFAQYVSNIFGHSPNGNVKALTHSTDSRYKLSQNNGNTQTSFNASMTNNIISYDDKKGIANDSKEKIELNNLPDTNVNEDETLYPKGSLKSIRAIRDDISAKVERKKGVMSELTEKMNFKQEMTSEKIKEIKLDLAGLENNFDKMNTVERANILGSGRHELEEIDILKIKIGKLENKVSKLGSKISGLKNKCESIKNKKMEFVKGTKGNHKHETLERFWSRGKASYTNMVSKYENENSRGNIKNFSTIIKFDKSSSGSEKINGFSDFISKISASNSDGENKIKFDDGFQFTKYTRKMGITNIKNFTLFSADKRHSEMRMAVAGITDLVRKDLEDESSYLYSHPAKAEDLLNMLSGTRKVKVKDLQQYFKPIQEFKNNSRANDYSENTENITLIKTHIEDLNKEKEFSINMIDNLKSEKVETLKTQIDDFKTIDQDIKKLKNEKVSLGTEISLLQMDYDSVEKKPNEKRSFSSQSYSEFPTLRDYNLRTYLDKQSPNVIKEEGSSELEGLGKKEKTKFLVGETKESTYKSIKSLRKRIGPKLLRVLKLPHLRSTRMHNGQMKGLPSVKVGNVICEKISDVFLEMARNGMKDKNKALVLDLKTGNLTLENHVNRYKYPQRAQLQDKKIQFAELQLKNMFFTELSDKKSVMSHNDAVINMVNDELNKRVVSLAAPANAELARRLRLEDQRLQNS